MAVGDLLLAQIAFEKGSQAGGNGNLTPAGWVREERTNSGSDLGQAIFYRIATAADLSTTSYTFPFQESVKAAGAISRYSGVDQADPFVDADGSAGASGALTAPAVTGVTGSLLSSRSRSPRPCCPRRVPT